MLEPIKGIICLRKKEGYRETKSGILLEASSDKEVKEAEIYAIHPLDEQEYDLHVGDLVMIRSEKALRVFIEQEEIEIILIQDLLAIKR